MIEDLMYQLSDGQAVIFSIVAALIFLLVVVAFALVVGSTISWIGRTLFGEPSGA